MLLQAGILSMSYPLFTDKQDRSLCRRKQATLVEGLCGMQIVLKPQQAICH